MSLIIHSYVSSRYVKSFQHMKYILQYDIILYTYPSYKFKTVILKYFLKQHSVDLERRRLTIFSNSCKLILFFFNIPTTIFYFILFERTQNNNFRMVTLILMYTNIIYRHIYIDVLYIRFF